MKEFTLLLVNWLQSTFHNAYVTTILASVVPMVEVRGAITIGNSLGMNTWLAYVLSCCSALIVCPILLLCLRPLLRALKRTKAFKNLATAVEETFISKAQKIENNAETEDITAEDGKTEAERKKRFNKLLGIFLFTAIPIPLTGVWTGSAVAAFLDLEHRYSVPAIILGNFVAGLIITVLNIILGDYSTLILLVLGGFVVISLVSFFIAFLIKYQKIKKSKANTEEKIEEEQLTR